MLKDILIDYRFVNKLQINNLGTINFFLGPSGSGKSSILDYIFLEKYPTANKLESFFDPKGISVSDTAFLEKVKKENLVDELVDYSIKSFGNNSKLEKNELLIPEYGNGPKKMHLWLGNAILFENHVFCFENIETDIYYTMYSDFSKLLLKYLLKFNNQLFTTCNSIEFIDSFLEAIYGDNSEFNFNEENDPVRIYTLRPSTSTTNFQTEMFTHTGLEAYKKRKDFGLDLR